MKCASKEFWRLCITINYWTIELFELNPSIVPLEADVMVLKLWNLCSRFDKVRIHGVLWVASSIIPIFYQCLVQGVPTRYDILWSPRWATKVDFQVQKKVAAHSGHGDIWVLSIYFQKSNIGWPQQPPTEKVTIFNLIFYDSINISFIWNMKIKWNFSLNY